MYSLITNIINNLFHVIWLCCIAIEPKYSPRKTAGIALTAGSCFQLLVIFMNYIGAKSPYKFLGGYFAAVAVFGGVFLFGLSASRPVKSLFLISMYFCLWTFIYGFIAIVTKTFAGAGGIAVWGLRVGLNLAFLFVYLVFFRRRLRRVYQSMENCCTTVAALSCMTFYMLTVLLVYNEHQKNHDIAHNILMFSCFGFMVAVYIVLFQYIARSAQEQELKQLQIHEKYLLAQLDSYGKMEQEMRQTRHDFRHHNLVVMEFARNGDSKGLLAYLQEYEQKEEAKTGKRYCGNRAVDNVLSAYIRRAGQNHIAVKTHICQWEEINISDYDLVSILANILENAVNGCMEAEGQRSMEISVSIKSAKLICICKNTCSDTVVFRNGLPRASGREGIGVESILNSAAKYGGNVDFFAKDGVFTCRVILNAFGAQTI